MAREWFTYSSYKKKQSEEISNGTAVRALLALAARPCGAPCAALWREQLRRLRRLQVPPDAPAECRPHGHTQATEQGFGDLFQPSPGSPGVRGSVRAVGTVAGPCRHSSIVGEVCGSRGILGSTRLTFAFAGDTATCHQHLKSHLLLSHIVFPTTTTS